MPRRPTLHMHPRDDDPWGGVQPKLSGLVRVGPRQYAMRGRHAVTGEPVEVPLAGGVTFRMLPRKPRGGAEPTS